MSAHARCLCACVCVVGCCTVALTLSSAAAWLISRMVSWSRSLACAAAVWRAAPRLLLGPAPMAPALLQIARSCCQCARHAVSTIRAPLPVRHWRTGLARSSSCRQRYARVYDAVADGRQRDRVELGLPGGIEGCNAGAECRSSRGWSGVKVVLCVVTRLLGAAGCNDGVLQAAVALWRGQMFRCEGVTGWLAR